MNKNNGQKTGDVAGQQENINSNLVDEFGDVNQYRELDAIGTGEERKCIDLMKHCFLKECISYTYFFLMRAHREAVYHLHHFCD